MQKRTLRASWHHVLLICAARRAWQLDKADTVALDAYHEALHTVFPEPADRNLFGGFVDAVIETNPDMPAGAVAKLALLLIETTEEA